MYTFEQHIHNYAVWTAARASQRGFTTTRKIKTAIESTSLQQFVKKSPNVNSSKFESLHRQWAKDLMLSLKKQKVNSTLISYGRVAKIISIYLKTSVIIRDNASTQLCSIIHPPIDFIFFKNISKHSALKDLKQYKWTTLNEKQYWEICNRIKNEFNYFNWRLEEYWSPELAI